MRQLTHIMNNLNRFILLFLLIWGGKAISAQTVFHLEPSQNSTLSVMFRGSFYKTQLDGSGSGTIAVPDTLKPDYATAYGDRKTYTFYLLPGARQEIRENADRIISFSGAGKEINEYLNSPELYSGMNSRMDEMTYLNQWKARTDRFNACLDSLQAPDGFKNIERKRLHYLSCEMLTRFMVSNQGPFKDEYYEILDSLMVEDPGAFELSVYRSSFMQWIDILARKDGRADTPNSRLMCQLDYVLQHIKDSRLAEFIIHQNVYGHIKRYGILNTDEAVAIYREKVTDQKNLNDFEELIGRTMKLAKGVRAPDFELTDIDGNKVSLSGLAGNYVYIDVWATWCGPCCREMGPLRELEHKFKDRPIRFVSISIDSDESAWREKIKAEHPGGIQLRAGSSTFERDYNVTFVPRFILIDPNGYIVDANMTRPSQPETAAELDGLK